MVEIPGLPEAKPTIFLNLDGVVHPAGIEYVLALDAIGAVSPKPFAWADLLRPVAEAWNVEVVFRSSATMVVGFEKLKAMAPDWLRPRIVGATGDTVRWIALFEARKVNSSCGVVRNYVKKHGLHWWVVLDDQDDGWHDNAMRRHLVKCDPALGLTDPDVLKRLDHALRAIRDAGLT